jgi:hypothetical protein
MIFAAYATSNKINDEHHFQPFRLAILVRRILPPLFLEPEFEPA